VLASLNKDVENGCAGDRTKDALLEFAEALVPSAGQPHRYIRGVTRIAKTPGCNLSGAAAVAADSRSHKARSSPSLTLPAVLIIARPLLTRASPMQ